MKKEIVYEVRETSVTVCGETVTSYGIACCQSGETVALVEDLSTDRDSVEKLAGICNSLDLEPGQLTEVAEDFVF